MRASKGHVTITACAIALLSAISFATPLGAEEPVAFRPAGGGDPLPEPVVVELVGAPGAPSASGLVRVIPDERGPDLLMLSVDGLPAGVRVTLFLAQDPRTGRLPVQFLGEFTVSEARKGRLLLKTEVIDAYAVANQLFENEEGIALDPDAGLLPPLGSAKVIPLDWIRAYFVPEERGTLAFGADAESPAGALMFSSREPLP